MTNQTKETIKQILYRLGGLTLALVLMRIFLPDEMSLHAIRVLTIMGITAFFILPILIGITKAIRSKSVFVSPSIATANNWMMVADCLVIFVHTKQKSPQMRRRLRRFRQRACEYVLANHDHTVAFMEIQHGDRVWDYFNKHFTGFEFAKGCVLLRTRDRSSETLYSGELADERIFEYALFPTFTKERQEYHNVVDIGTPP